MIKHKYLGKAGTQEDINEVKRRLALKRDNADSYSKTEIDTALAEKQNAADSYSKSEIDTALAEKRDISDSYSKTEIDTAMAEKRDISDSYSKTQVYTKAEIDALLANIIPAIEADATGRWEYRVFANNTFEAWYKQIGVTLEITQQSGALYRSNAFTVTLPTEITDLGTINLRDININMSHANYPSWGELASITATGFTAFALSGNTRGPSSNYIIMAYVMGDIMPNP